MSNISRIAIVGSSFEGYKVAKDIFGELKLGEESCVILVPHIYPGEIYSHLKMKNKKVSPIYDGLTIEPGNIYIGMDNETIGLKYELEIGKRDGDYKFFIRNRIDEASVDRAFLETARVFKEKTIGVILYGAGDDGIIGMKRIKEVGGKTLIQKVDDMTDKGSMPWHVMRNCEVDYILPPKKLGYKLEEMLNSKEILNFKYPHSSYIL